ncbi:hypothetical protein [Bounagaea algeriensis]
MADLLRRGAVFVITLFREWGIKLVAGADWLRVNRKWVDTYALTHVELRGVWFGWMLRLRPGFEAMRRREERFRVPERTVWTLLLVVAVVLGAIYQFRPELLGLALAVLAGIVLLVGLVCCGAIAALRRKDRRGE